MNAPTDVELVELALTGSQDAYRRLVERYERPLFSLVVRMVRDPGQAEDLAQLVIAYEPVWAIGTGRTATPAQAEEVHVAIRKQLGNEFGGAGIAVRIQYGGSVKADNAESLMGQANVDGALVGGASLQAPDFVAIVKAARVASER